MQLSGQGVQALPELVASRLVTDTYIGDRLQLSPKCASSRCSQSQPTEHEPVLLAVDQGCLGVFTLRHFLLHCRGFIEFE